MRKFTFGKNELTESSMPYVIAEIGVNHEGSFDKAIELINLAKAGGAQAVKFQSYKAHTLASKNSPSYWDLNKEPTTSQFQLFKKYDSFDSKEYIKLYEHSQKIGIDFLSTPFDDDSLEFLTPLMNLIKIASADLTNTPFLRKVAQTGKPVVLSTGASTLREIEIAVHELKTHGTKELSLLHCILNYPTLNENAHLGMIESLKRTFPDILIGYSDHTLPDQEMTALTTSYLKGATLIEKHFTHDKSLPGNDHYHAMDKIDCQNFFKRVSKIKSLLGNNYKEPLPNETLSRENARRSIVLKEDITAGSIISESDLTYKRPAHGISPIHWDEVIGKKVIQNLKEDHILKWSDLEG